MNPEAWDLSFRFIRICNLLPMLLWFFLEILGTIKINRFTKIYAIMFPTSFHKDYHLCNLHNSESLALYIWLACLEIWLYGYPCYTIMNRFRIFQYKAVCLTQDILSQSILNDKLLVQCLAKLRLFSPSSVPQA